MLAFAIAVSDSNKPAAGGDNWARQIDVCCRVTPRLEQLSGRRSAEWATPEAGFVRRGGLRLRFESTHQACQCPP